MEVWVRPNSGGNRIHGIDSWIKRSVVSVRAPPTYGKTNHSLITILSSTFEIPKDWIRIVQGATSRKKSVEIIGLEMVEFQEVGER